MLLKPIDQNDSHALESLLLNAIRAALAAGQDILEVYQGDFAVERKEDGSALTEADQRAHQRITNILESTGIPLLSEEGSAPIPFDVRKSWPCLWVVDPLDGTEEFTERNGEFTVNIALVQNETPLIGVVYAPVTKVLYYASHGRGAYKLEDCKAGDVLAVEELLQRSLRLPLNQERNDFVVVVSRRNSTPKTEAFIERVQTPDTPLKRISVGSSIKICAVAEGVADIYPRFQGTWEWDTAAGQAIVREAGGRIIDWETGCEIAYNRENLRNNHFVVFRSEAVYRAVQPRVTGF